MTARGSGVNPRTGGRIRPDGRTPSAPGVGGSSKRHDLERPATPGLSNSSLQQGDVGELEQGQAIAPRAGSKRVQGPAQGGGAPPPGQRGNFPTSTGLPVPNPIDFAGSRFAGTLGREEPRPRAFIDTSAWFPLLRQLVSNPNSGGTLARAFIEQLSTLRRQPFSPRPAAIDLGDMDDALEAGLDR